jgi:hypothetical protein
MVMDEAMTPPRAPVPALPLNVVVPAPLEPHRTLKVVADTEPATIRCLKDMVTGALALDEIIVPAAKALAVESRNRAATNAVVPAKLLASTTDTSICKMFAASVGVIDRVRYSLPSVI